MMKMRQRGLALLLSGTMALGLLAGCSTEKETAEDIYTPGTYEGQAQGFGGPVTVKLTVDGSKITEAVVTGENETADFGGKAIPQLQEQVMKAQSADIDGVSGATVTSTAVKEAAGKAIAAAKGEQAEVKPLTPGTYTATKEGYQRCHVTVSVTVDETRIQDVQIVECTDNPITVTETPCREIPAAILAHQTYNVDGVTGATFTSNAIKNAVKDCLDQAGGSDGFSAPVEKAPLTQGEDVHTDVLVVGGGGAGMTAAVEAYTGGVAGETSGLEVIMIEKAGFLGGTTSVSGGVRFQYADETGKYDDTWVESVVEAEKATLQPYMELEFNEDLIRGQARVMNKTNQLLDGIGVVSIPGAWGASLASPDDHEDRWGGSFLTYAVNQYLPKTDIDVRLNTRATKLITDDAGAVVGVEVQDKTSTYNIYAQKVILACGDFVHNEELIAQYAPEFVGGIPFAAGTNTGDGFLMALEIGAVPLGDKMMGTMGADAIVGQSPDYKPFLNYGAGRAMYVNKNGQRFCQENLTMYVTHHALLQQEGQVGWGIVDANNPMLDVLANSTSEYVCHADTLEELAEMLEIPADALQATVEKYNGYFRAGEDKDFGVPVEQMRPIEEGPYYAFRLRPILMSSMVGLKADGECRILREDGSAIPNLFGAGNVIFGGNITSYYVAAHGVGTAVYTGDLAAAAAVKEILAENK